MADIDWGSLAATILPAVVGGVTGSRTGFGAVPGALYGLSSGVRTGLEMDMERNKLNTEIAFKNQQSQQAQQRIEQENQKIEMERQNQALQARNYDRLERIADEQVKNYELERKKHQLDIDAATRSVEGQTKFRGLLKPDQQAAFDAAPDKQKFIDKYYADKDWEEKTKSSAAMLTRLGLDEKTAQMLGPQGTSHLLGSIMESRNKPRERFGFHYDSSTGMGFSYDKETGAVNAKQIGEKTVPPEKRTVIEKSMLDLWKARNGPLAKLSEESGDWSAYDEWRSSPIGKVEAAYRSGAISFDEAQGYRESFSRQEKEVDAKALQGMRQTAPNMSDAEFQAFVDSPKGVKLLQQWKDYARTGGRPQASAPVAEKKPTISGNDKKRPSLDDIFGK